MPVQLQNIERKYFYYFIFVLVILSFYDVYLEIIQLIPKHQIKSELKFKEHEAKARILKSGNAFAMQHDAQEKIARYSRQDNPSILGAEFLSAILQASHLYGLHVHSIFPDEWQSISESQRLAVHVQASGSFLQFAAFLQWLAMYPLCIAWQDLSFEVKANGDDKIEVTLLTMYFSPQQKSTAPNLKKTPVVIVDFIKQRNPFLKMNTNSFERNNDSYDSMQDLSSISLKQIQWIGFLHDNKRFWALAKLPNGNTIPISQNMVVGSEQAKVILLDETKIIFHVNGQALMMNFAI